MSYRAKDGKHFPTVTQGRKYDQSLVERGRSDVANAPGGPSWEHDIKTYGPPARTEVIQDGPGRHMVRAYNRAGDLIHQSVHPELHRANEIHDSILGIEPPPAIQTHARARSHPVGPKEEERVAREDGRLAGETRYEDYEER